MSQRFFQMGTFTEEVDADGGEVLDTEDIENIEIDEYEEEPYYFDADNATKNAYQNKHNLALKIDPSKRPSLKALIDTVLRERDNEDVLFEQGMYVEYRSKDMQWKIGRVNRVLRQPPDEWDFDTQGDIPADKLDIFYNVGIEGVVSADDIRAPKVGLQRVFGSRPWLWQQMTLLQLEKRIRFDINHEFDFEEIDNLEFATIRYDRWLNCEKNDEFKKWHDSEDIPEQARKLLRSHLMEPFDQLDFIVEKKDDWDFDDEDISVYTYLGVLGSGLPISLITMAIQITAPLVLLYNSIHLSDGDANPRFELDPETTLPLNGDFLPGTTYDQFCLVDLPSAEFPGRVEGKVLTFFVILIYLCTVIPDSILVFFRTSGGADSTYSKINSLREIIWRQSDDDMLQQIGYKLDRLMNTGYISILYGIMLFILLNTPLALDVILNALAIEFIHKIDEKIANADWWDGDNRWIRAGTLELVLQSALRLQILESPRKLCAEYDIDIEEYRKALGGLKSLSSSSVAAKDDEDPRFMTTKERTYQKVAQLAISSNNEFVAQEYQKEITQVGITGQVAAALGLRKKGMFHRYPYMRTWSRWEDILFLPTVPTRETLDADKASRKAAYSKDIIMGRSDTMEFLSHITSVLSGRELVYTVGQSITHLNFVHIPIKIMLGIVEIIFYWLQLFFPVAGVFLLFFFPLCY